MLFTQPATTFITVESVYRTSGDCVREHHTISTPEGITAGDFVATLQEMWLKRKVLRFVKVLGLEFSTCECCQDPIFAAAYC
jgi:hypothetical protein